jgi:hypothetical protein
LSKFDFPAAEKFTFCGTGAVVVAVAGLVYPLDVLGGALVVCPLDNGLEYPPLERVVATTGLEVVEIGLL